MSRDYGSFRDPEGHVFSASGRVFRGISSAAAPRVRRFIHSDFYKKRAGSQIVETMEVSSEEAASAGISIADVDSFEMWVEHSRIPLISYPYEWPFESLKEAGRLTLNLLIDGLHCGYTLKDASAFNVQFINTKPIFIDVLSFTEYREGEPFIGYKQFCEHFLAPLCLSACAGIDYNTWFRGRLEGLDLVEVSKALPVVTRFRMQILMHLHLQAWAMQRVRATTSVVKRKRHRPVSRRNLVALCDSLKKFITKLQRQRSSYWQQYSGCNSYSDSSSGDKVCIAREFIMENNIREVLDLGCNTGEYSRVAVDAGARRVIGTDVDCGAIDIAFKDARKDSLPIQVLYFDITNPSPDMGWMYRERLTLEQRLGQTGGIFCFALIHHIVIGRNIPIEFFVRWVCGLAPKGLIEFVPKSDPMVQGLLRDREDIFVDYDQANLERILQAINQRVVIHAMQSSSRVIYAWER